MAVEAKLQTHFPHKTKGFFLANLQAVVHILHLLCIRLSYLHDMRGHLSPDREVDRRGWEPALTQCPVAPPLSVGSFDAREKSRLLCSKQKQVCRYAFYIHVISTKPKRLLSRIGVQWLECSNPLRTTLSFSGETAWS